MAPKAFFSTWADTLTESPSAITASSPTKEAMSLFYGGIMQTIAVKRT
jgi:hypothetical protein